MARHCLWDGIFENGQFLAGKIDDPIRGGQQSQGAGQLPGVWRGKGEHRIFQGNKNPFHAEGDQDTPEQGVFKADVAMKVKPVGGIAPESEAEHLLKEITGDELQPGGDKGGEQKIDEEGPLFSGVPPGQKSALSSAGGSDQEIHQQEGKSINGAEGQRHKAAVIEAAIACQEEEGLHRPAQEGDQHEQYEILACTLERTSHPVLPTF